MKFNITPFTIISPIALITAIYFLYNIPKGKYGGYLILIVGVVFVITLVLDVIFRFSIKSLQTIWIVETVLALIGLVFFFV
ncbi:hypothetical protein ABIE26_003879 [Pedobacter africanus]|uniref:Uncharacterized protein n=1 Tax=Pedobacter africanus TaxID=151894 RepID=A0ACC6L173_9SPHI|nr:hypothetical protein [Pedobacter africanus]